jgi:glutamyl-tRNA synthetase
MAPSPTGFTHLGTARTAVFNWLFARHSGGKFIVRIEDTDRKRLVPGSLEDLLGSFRWLGLDWDEGPEVGGPVGPYFQSERLGIYHDHIRRLIGAGAAYACACSEERLEGVRTQQVAAGRRTGYDRRCRNMSDQEQAEVVHSGRAYVVRLKMPLRGRIVMYDVIRGDITFEARELEDIVLLKSDGYPTYHLANVVDDHLMSISHIMRGDEWIPSAPYHLVMYEALAWQPPVYVHLPMMLNPDGHGKLSKRKTVDEHGALIENMTLVREFRAAGYLPEALFNFLAMQGWAISGDRDLFSRAEAVAAFGLENVKKSPAALSYEKLYWMNGEYMRSLSDRELGARLLPFLPHMDWRTGPDVAPRLARLVRERIKTLAEAGPLVAFLWKEFAIAPEALLPPKTPDVALTERILDGTRARLEALADWSEPDIETALRGLVEALGEKPGVVFHPIRMAATGQRVAPPLFGSLELLGRSRTLERLETAVAALKTYALATAT